jgi:hypothetical protein
MLDLRNRRLSRFNSKIVNAKVIGYIESPDSKSEEKKSFPDQHYLALTYSTGELIVQTFSANYDMLP